LLPTARGTTAKTSTKARIAILSSGFANLNLCTIKQNIKIMTISENALSSSPDTSSQAINGAAEFESESVAGFVNESESVAGFVSESDSEDITEATPVSSNGFDRSERSKHSKRVVVPQQSRAVSQRGSTLQRRLLLTILPTVLVPLAIASGVGIWFAQRQSRDSLLNNLEQGVFLTSEATETVLDEAFEASDLLASTPSVITALVSSSKQVREQKLLNKPIEQVEQQYARTKLLSPYAILNDYLQKIADDKGIAEIILTEANGFNVAYNTITSDFVQSDEEWWQIGKEQGRAVLKPEFDESSNSVVLELVSSINAPDSGELLGVTKVGLSIAALNEAIEEFAAVELSETAQLQIIDTSSGKALNTVTLNKMTLLGEVIGGSPVATIAAQWTNAVLANPQDPNQILPTLENQPGITKVSVRQSQIGVDHFILSFELEGRQYEILTVSDTQLVVVASVDLQEVAAAGQSLGLLLGMVSIGLGVAAIGVIIWLAKQLSNPLANLSEKAQQVADGDLDMQADLEGTVETMVLAENFNNLVQRVKGLISEQEAIAQQQRREKETLEEGIYKLLDDVGDALDGDLTVRASLESMEMSTVADLFNAIIDSLNDIAVQVKHSSARVGASLGQNETSIQLLAKQAVEETAETRKALSSVQQMSRSIQEVAQNASQASVLAKDAYAATQKGTEAIDETVDSMLSLRETVNETAAKMKYLEESSRQISQVVSLIEEIALKTNLLAINAGRAGEHGQGFSVFGKQLGALAEQSVTATKEIAQIVAAIQLETQEVAQAMELGSAKATDSTRLVQTTKQRLGRVLQRSQSINELMQSISEATISQTKTSRSVTQLMEQIAQQSEQRLASSQQISESMQDTVKVAKSLESAVEQFKVTEAIEIEATEV
jgi:methyl-accepting chemotaxis protein PixJ